MKLLKIFTLSSLLIGAQYCSQNEAMGAFFKLNLGLNHSEMNDRSPASIKKLKHNKFKKKQIVISKQNGPNLAKARNLLLKKKSPLLQNWSNWNSFTINVVETFTHNPNIYGTYKLSNSHVDVLRPIKKQSGLVFTKKLDGQHGHLVLKKGKAYLFRHMTDQNFTKVFALDFPIVTKSFGKERFISAKLDEEDKRFFIKVKHYLPIFKNEETAETKNYFIANYDTDIQFHCNKDKPSSYTCQTQVVFTKKFANMISENKAESKSLKDNEVQLDLN